MTKKRYIPKKYIIHCSGSDIPEHDNLETIQRWHLERGFSDIGYHYVITTNGKYHRGRSIFIAGAHTYGQNRDSIGICLTGNNTFTKVQFFGLVKLLLELEAITGISAAKRYPHNYFNKSKTCPRFDVEHSLTEYFNYL